MLQHDEHFANDYRRAVLEHVLREGPAWEPPSEASRAHFIAATAARPKQNIYKKRLGANAVKDVVAHNAIGGVLPDGQATN